jgi:5,10-methylenetetrahydrofolate reductase
MHLVSSLDRGRDLGGKSFGPPTTFFAGVLADPGAPDTGEESLLLRRKMDAGARFVVTAPVFRPDLLDALLANMGNQGIPVIASIRPLTSLQEAVSLCNEIPGAAIPETLLSRLSAAGSPERELQEGLAAARETLDSVRPLVNGVEVIAPGGRTSLALEILGL